MYGARPWSLPLWMLRLTWIKGSHCLTCVSLYLRLASSHQIKTKLFIVLLEEMIGQFCWHVRIHCLNTHQCHQYVYALFVPAPFEWQGPAQTTLAWGYRRGRKVQTGFWSAAQTWSALSAFGISVDQLNYDEAGRKQGRQCIQYSCNMLQIPIYNMYITRGFMYLFSM